MPDAHGQGGVSPRPTSGDVQELAEVLVGDFPTGDSAEQAARQVLDNRGDALLPDLIRSLTNYRCPLDEAKQLWLSVLEHRVRLREILGRDPGLRVSALDYFSNILGRSSKPHSPEADLVERLYREATSDPLTGLANRRSYRARLLDEIVRAKRYKTTFVQLIFDLDNFKKVNDTRGHVYGDQILKQVADILRHSIREADLAGRWGGEEFVVLMPQTSKKGGRILAERIRESVMRDLAESDVTISGGLASFPVDGDDEERLFTFADRCLYRAKAEGKNRICPSPIERRAFPRVDAELQVRIVSNVDSGLDLTTKTTNISLGGLGFHYPAPLWVTGTVKGEIEIEQSIVHFVGRVVYVEEMLTSQFDVGVQFIEIAPEDTRLLRLVTD
jgi:two-component system cell cycle response regulator